MPQIHYRQSETSDIPAMARFRALKRGNTDYWIDRMTQYFAGEHNPQFSLPPRVGFVAQEEDAVVGFIAGHLTRRYSCKGEVQWIHVAPERRRTGVASELLRLLAKWFVEQNAFKVCVDVDPSNIPGLQLYKRHGAVVLNPLWLVWDDIRPVAGQSDTIKTTP